MQHTFSAEIVTGAGRGRTIGTPTINLAASALRTIGRDGIYAVWVHMDSLRLPAVMHAGPRPVFHDTPSVEVHLLSPPPTVLPTHLTVEIIQYLRPVQDFQSIAALQEQIQDDIQAARATLGLDAAPPEEARP